MRTGGKWPIIPAHEPDRMPHHALTPAQRSELDARAARAPARVAQRRRRQAQDPGRPAPGRLAQPDGGHRRLGRRRRDGRAGHRAGVARSRRADARSSRRSRALPTAVTASASTAAADPPGASRTPIRQRPAASPARSDARPPNAAAACRAKRASAASPSRPRRPHRARTAVGGEPREELAVPEPRVLRLQDPVVLVGEVDEARGDALGLQRVVVLQPLRRRARGSPARRG